MSSGLFLSTASLIFSRAERCVGGGRGRMKCGNTRAHTPIVMRLPSHILGDPTPLEARQLYRPVSSLATALNSCSRDREGERKLFCRGHVELQPSN